MKRPPVLPADDALARALRFGADAAHELKTPLALAHAELERTLASSALAGTDRESVEAALGQLRRIDGILHTLLVLARADAGQLGLCPAEGDLAALSSALVRRMRKSSPHPAASRSPSRRRAPLRRASTPGAPRSCCKIFLRTP